MRVVVTGSRAWTDHNLITRFLTGLYEESTVGHLTVIMAEFVLIEGGCPTGADEIAAGWAEHSPFHSHNEREDEPYFEHQQYKADWPPPGSPRWMRAKAGHERNQRMLDESKPDLVLAFKDDFDLSRGTGGTEDCVRRAMDMGIEVVHIAHLSSGRLLTAPVA